MSAPGRRVDIDGYGSPPVEWDRVAAVLATTPGKDAAQFLGTVSAAGEPHVNGIGSFWDEDAGVLFFTSSPKARKARNLAENPRCTIAGRLDDLDLTFEGSAEIVTDAAVLEHVATRYREGGWPAEVSGTALDAPFNAPTAGPRPWQVYRFTPKTLVVLATEEPGGAVRFEFD
jgi:hypothetical protein